MYIGYFFKNSLKFVLYKLFANSAPRWVFLWSKIISNIAKSYQFFFHYSKKNHRKFVLILRYLKWFCYMLKCLSTKICNKLSYDNLTTLRNYLLNKKLWKLQFFPKPLKDWNKRNLLYFSPWCHLAQYYWRKWLAICSSGYGRSLF